VSNITKHYSEQEWESNHGKYCGVNFFVHRDTIGVNDFLEDIRELICLDVSRWFNGVVFESLEISSRVLTKYIPNLVFIFIRGPEVSDVS
jgi:hypothetical protein